MDQIDPNGATLHDVEKEFGVQGNIHRVDGYNTRAVTGLVGENHKIFIPQRAAADVRAVLAYNRDRGVVVPQEKNLIVVPQASEEATFTHDVSEAWDQDSELRDAMQSVESVTPFIDSPDHQKLVQKMGKGSIGTLDGSEKWNNKGSFMNQMQEAGLPTPEGSWARTPKEVLYAAEMLLFTYHEVAIKPARGASGFSLVRARSVEEVRTALETNDGLRKILQPHPPAYPEKGPGIRVEAWTGTEREIPADERKEVIASPSTVLWIDDQRALVVQESQQVLNGEEHQGNIWPLEGPWVEEYKNAVHRQLRHLLPIALTDRALGWIGLDHVVSRYPNDTIQTEIIEANKRYTGSLPGRLPQLNNGWNGDGSYFAGNVPLQEQETMADFFQRLDSEHLAYSEDRKNDAWVIPLNFPYQKAQILIHAECRAALVDLLDHFGVKYTTKLRTESPRRASLATS